MDAKSFNTARLFPSLSRRLNSFAVAMARDTKGQDLVEYALLTGFIVVAVWAVFPTDIYPSISNIFSRLLSTASVMVP